MAVLCVFQACSKAESEAVDTKEIIATINVYDNETSISCEANFKVGGITGTYLELTGDDYSECNGQRMIKSINVLNQVTYTATVPKDSSRPIRFIFKRQNEVYQSEVGNAEPVQVIKPLKQNEFLRKEAIEVEWHKAVFTDAPMHITAMLEDSTGTSSQTVTKTVSESINKILLVETAELAYKMPQGTIYVKILLRQSVSGRMASGLQGSISNRWQRSIPVILK